MYDVIFALLVVSLFNKIYLFIYSLFNVDVIYLQ